MPRTLKIWLTRRIPVRITIREIVYEIRADDAGASLQINLEAARLDNGRSLKLHRLPASWYRDEYDRHACFESLPGTPARKLADALLIQGLAVLEPRIGWSYRYEKNLPWKGIALGCEYHDGNGWRKKTIPEPPPQQLSGYIIRY